MNNPSAATQTPPTGLPIVAAARSSWLALEAEPASARTVRQFTRLVLGEDKSLIDDALLVVDELVGNAIVHRPGDFEVPAGVSPYIHLSLQSWRSWLIIAVVDPWPGIPVPRVAGEADEGGRGLAVVQALAAGWWTDRRVHDKTVHALLLRPGHTITPAELERFRS